MLANGVPRAKILLGKIVGGTLTLLVPFLLSLVLGLIVILLNPRVAWGGSDWGMLGVLLAGAAVYVAFFQVLGVFISARHQSSSASIMTSLCVWVLLVLVVPNLSPYFASLVSPAPSRIKIGREASRLLDIDRDDLGRRLEADKMR
jgi:ABC-type transport system involved in multi-copper enzyme maturation permease subunit